MAPAGTPHDLQTEHATEPLGIVPGTTRFQWRYPPAAPVEELTGRVIVATSQDHLRAGEGDVWESGWLSDSQQAVTYDGDGLAPETRYWWTVGSRIGDGEVSWAEPTWFETGIDSWTGTWIGAADDEHETAPAPRFRRTFRVDGEIDDARLYLAVGGLYEARMNGERVGDRVLDTAVTDYEERVPYATHDVTAHLTSGENVLEITAGRGRYALTTETTWGWHAAPWHRPTPQLLAELVLEAEDGATRRIATDEDWTVAASPTRFDSIYEGDVYDARVAESSGTERTSARPVDGPAGQLDSQGAEPMRVVDTLEPTEITEPTTGVNVFDFGEVTAGWAKLRVDGPAGTEVRLRYGEQLADDGTVATDQPHVEGAFQTDRYVLGGQGVETWSPRFSYKGFRYVEVEGLPSPPTSETLRAQVVHTAVDEGPTSTFDCADDLLCRIHDNSRRTFLNNFHGIPTDTPAYEKNGWTGDATAGIAAAAYHFPLARFVRKWLADFADAQRPDGELPPIVPTSGFGYSEAPFDEAITSPNPGWDAAYLWVAWTIYRHTGDERIIRDHYDGMKACVEYFRRHATDGILDAGLGDWLAPGHGEIRARPPEGTAITGTAYYYRVVDLLVRMADQLGRDNDVATYAERRSAIADAFNRAFLDAESGVYATGAVEEYRQTSNVLPLAFGIVPEDRREQVVDRLVADVLETHDGHLNTGFHGTPYLLPVLTRAGHVDVAYTIATQESYPSWGHWITEHGATTHYEMWELDSRSRDHYAYGAIDEWFYGELAGIRPATPGFEQVSIRPHVPTDLPWVDATVETVRGPVSVRWEQTGRDQLELDVELPGNTPASVRLPGADDATVDGDPLGAADGVEDVSHVPDGIGCTVGPGSHAFACWRER